MPAPTVEGQGGSPHIVSIILVHGGLVDLTGTGGSGTNSSMLTPQDAGGTNPSTSVSQTGGTLTEDQSQASWRDQVAQEETESV